VVWMLRCLYLGTEEVITKANKRLSQQGTIVHIESDLWLVPWLMR
jgi:hypothetical protein